MKVAIAGGGTGGHFFPALALYKYLKEQGYSLLFIGSKGGIEESFKDEINCKLLNSAKLRGGGVLRLLKGGIKNGFASLRAYKILKNFSPDAVVLFGGYSSLPVGLAANFLKVPLFLHEQNTVPGKTNLFISKFAEKVLLGFKDAQVFFKGKGIFVGNPLRKEVLKYKDFSKERLKEELGIGKSRKVILVMGGSQGAKWINENFSKALSFLKNLRGELFIIHITGKGKSGELRQTYSELGFKHKVFEFFKDMGKLYRVSDFAVSRAGALSITELSAFGIPALFIPYPFAADDHQYKNAVSACSGGGCIVKRQGELSQRLLAQILTQTITDDKKLSFMSEAMKTNFVSDSLIRIERILNDGRGGRI